MADPKGPLNLLALGTWFHPPFPKTWLTSAEDGGGIRGVCEVLVLQKIMYRLQKLRGLEEEPKPCDYFHLVGGTSTGGLIALMLGRFRMTATQCLGEYTTLAKTVFGEPKIRFGIPSKSGMFSATNLKEAVQDLAIKRGEQKDARMILEEESPACRRYCNPHHPHVLDCFADGITFSFVTALPSANFESPVLLRTYKSRSEMPIECTIWEAARATTAASTFFKPVDIKRHGGRTTTFIDAGLRVNNPLEVVMKEAQECYGPDRKVQCILSLGTGHKGVMGIDKKSNYPVELLNCLTQLATDCILVDKRYANRFQDRDGFYFRFNLDHGAENISLKDWKEINTLSDHVDTYMDNPRVNKDINAVVGLLCNPRNVDTLPSLSSINLG
jgi:hypothetical protein